VVIPGQGEGSKLKAPKTSGGGRTPVRHTIPLGIVIFLVKYDSIYSIKIKVILLNLFLDLPPPHTHYYGSCYHHSIS